MASIGQVKYFQAAINSAASGDREIVAAVANHRIAVHGYVLVSDSSTKGAVRFESAAGGTALTGAMEVGHDDGTRIRPTSIIAPFSEVPWFITDAEAVSTDDNLSLEVGASAIDGHIIYSLIKIR